MQRLAVMTILHLLGALASTGVIAQHVSAQESAAFTTEQAERGRRIYGAQCATCHGTQLEGAVGPALAGTAFLRKWGAAERGAGDLLDVLRTTMPRPGAGSLSPEAYDAVFAYMLQHNGLAAEDREFDGTSTALKSIRLDRLGAAAPPGSMPPPQFLTGEKRMVPSASGPTQAELSANDDPDNWLYHTGSYAGTRHSPLAQITHENVSGLAVTCAYQVGSTETFQPGPIVYRGVMYVTTATLTVALHAATCRERWRHTWDPQDEALWPNNRGVAVKDGYVVRGTPDGYLLALDAIDGTLLWARQVAKPALGETITMAPMIFENLILIGPAGSENNIQGWVGAFRLSDGMPVWTFHTVPRPGEPGAETWAEVPGVPAGGGAVWTPLSLDVDRGELYVAVTNPAPDLPAHLRPGTNLYTNAVVALDVRTGALRWYEQLVPSDFHDWDLTQVSPLVRATVAGKERDVIFTAGKDGLLHAIDRHTRERLYQVPVTTRSNVDAPLTREGTHVCPGMLGGVEWNGPAYDPGTGTVFVPAVDWCFTLALADTVRFVPGELYLGGTATPDSTQQGWLTAVRVSDGTVRWRHRSSRPMVAAVTTTAGGLVLTGEMSGDFLALDAATGEVLSSFYSGSGMLGGVVTYAVEGKQYIAAMSGGGSFTFGPGGSGTIFVFALPER